MLQLAIKGATHSSSKHRETTYHCCCCVLLHSLRSETSSSCDTCTGRRAIKFLGSTTLPDCSLVRTTTSWWCKLPFDYLLVVCASVPLLSEGRSWDGTASILFCIKLDRLLRAAQHVDCWERHHRNSGTGPASGYNLVLSHLFIVFFLFLYRLSANTINPYTVIMLTIFTYSMI
jgi:hypothetical protein